MNALAEICQKVLNCKISLEEFYQLTENIEENEFNQIVISDLEDAIEHTPANFFTNRIDEDYWKKSDIYKKVLIDYTLINRQSSINQKIALRKKVLSEGIPVDEIKDNTPDHSGQTG